MFNRMTSTKFFAPSGLEALRAGRPRLRQRTDQRLAEQSLQRIISRRSTQMDTVKEILESELQNLYTYSFFRNQTATATDPSISCFYFDVRIFDHILTPVFVLDARGCGIELTIKIDQVDLHCAGQACPSPQGCEFPYKDRFVS